MALLLYVDTNVLMEHVPLDQLPIDSIVGDHVDAIVIPYQVMKEIDDHKYSMDKRIRRRAEAASKLLVGICATGELASGQTLLVVRPRGDFDYGRYDLNRDSQDDRVMASLLQGKQDNGDDRHLLLTADQHFVVLAKELGVECVVLSDHRLIPGEPEDHTPRPKPVLLLEHGLTFVEASVPMPPDRERLLADAVAEYWEEPITAPEGSMAAMIQAATRFQTPFSWPNSRGDVEAHAEALYSYAVTTMRAIAVTLEIANTGSVPAEDVDVVLTFPAATAVPAAEDDLPDYPVNRDPLNLARLNYAGILAPASNGPFVERSKDGEWTARYHLQRVKHGLTEVLETLFLVPPCSDDPASFGFEYSLHCANLAKPVAGTLNVKLSSSGRLDFQAIKQQEDS